MAKPTSNNPYQAPQAPGPKQSGDWDQAKRVLSIPVGCLSIFLGGLTVLAVFGVVAGLLGEGGQLIGSAVGVGVWGSLAAGAFALARALWNPKVYSRAAIDQGDLRAIYAQEGLAQLPAGDVGIYAQTEDGELVRLHARVRPDRLPQRHRELLARIKERVEQLDAD